MTEQDQDRLRRRHREMLVVTCLIILLAFLLEVRPDQRVHLAGLPGLPLPPSCASREWFGMPCPGCGLTRSFIHLAQGDWSASLRDHRLGWLLGAAVLIQLPYRLVALRGRRPEPLGSWLPRLFGYLLIVLLIGNWAWEMAATRLQ
jgi:hypothetical protein